MFRKHHKRFSFLPFVIFRLVLSVIMLGFLILASYSAYKHFSGLDPLGLNPQSIISSLKDYENLPPFLENLLASLKIKGITGENQKTLADFIGGVSNSASRETLSENTDHGEKILTFILIADSHTDNFNLNRALTQAKNKFPEAEFTIGLGDYTNVGTLEELTKAKNEFDKTNLRYFLTAGDHDLWHSRDQQLSVIANFNQVFGPQYQSFTVQNLRMIVVFNSDNYTGLDDQELEWLSRQVTGAKEQNQHILVFLHVPLYHPSSDHVMGRVEPKLKDQAKDITRLFSDSGVKKVFAADTHYFSEYKEPETMLEMVTIGAVTAERNPQAPRYAVVEVFEDGTAQVHDIQIQ